MPKNSRKDPRFNINRACEVLHTFLVVGLLFSCGSNGKKEQSKEVPDSIQRYRTIVFGENHKVQKLVKKYFPESAKPEVE